MEEQAGTFKRLAKSTENLDRAIASAKRRIESLKVASRQIERGDSHTMSAALVEVIGLADLRKAVQLLDSDLQVREYQFELRGGFGSRAHQRFSDDMVKLQKIDKLMDELGIPPPEKE